jgi:hypothetical protein
MNIASTTIDTSVSLDFIDLTLLINPATIYIVFSLRLSVRSKASERRFSHSKASSDNAVCGQTGADLSF